MSTLGSHVFETLYCHVPSHEPGSSAPLESSPAQTSNCEGPSSQELDAATDVLLPKKGVRPPRPPAPIDELDV